VVPVHPTTIDPATGEFTPREVEREKFSNATLESRLNWSFPLFGRTSTLAAGIRAFAGRMHRQEGGPGTTGSDFDMTVTGPYEKDVNFYNTNLAGHIEQVVVSVSD
jgi:Fe(3+) dicitrate transport protein